MNTSNKRKWGWGFRISAFVLPFIVCLLLVEMTVRVFVDEPILPRFMIDPGYGVRANQPGVVTRHYAPGEYETTVTTNSSGMRGTRDYSLKKPEGVHRIIMLGDSMVFGFGVEDDEVTSVVLEDLLNAEEDRDQRYEVLNFSVSGFGQAELLVTYTQRARSYDADTVILFFYDNDIGNNRVSNLFELVDGGTVERTGKEYLPGVRTREILYALPPVRWLFEHSQAWNFIRNRLSSIVQKSLLRKQGLETFSSDNPEALELTRALLRRFIEEIQADGAEPVVVIIPNSLLTSNFPMTAESITDLGADLVDGRDVLVRGDYYVYDIHMRPTGHRKVAEQLLATFQKP